jgi:hypothetical protein
MDKNKLIELIENVNSYNNHEDRYVIICGDNLKEELNKLLENTEHKVIGCGDGIIDKNRIYIVPIEEKDKYIKCYLGE